MARRLAGPAVAVAPGDARGRGCVGRALGPEREDALAVARWGHERHADTPQGMRGALGSPDTDALLGAASGCDAARRTERTHALVRAPRVLSGHAPRVALGDPAQEGTGIEVPVLAPEVARVHGLQDAPTQGACLGLPICTQADVRHQPVGWCLDDQRLAGEGPAWQRAPCFEPMRRGCNTIAIDHLAPRSREPRRPGAAAWGDTRRQAGGAVPSQCLCRVRLHTIELVLDRNQGDADRVFVLPVGRMPRGLAAQDPGAESRIDGRKEERPRVLLLCGALIPGIKGLRTKHAFEEATDQDAIGLVSTQRSKIVPNMVASPEKSDAQALSVPRNGLPAHL